MPGISISALSTQYILVPVRAWSQGQPYDPTGDSVSMAFTAFGTEPSEDDWNTASWAWTTTVNGYYAVQCLVGPGAGAVSLALGTYSTWVMITGSPEVPVIDCGSLTITP